MALVTLTTDFGTSDGYVGAMKGVIASLAPSATIIDVAHDVPRHDIAAGAFALAQAAPQFPDGTIHVVVIDPGVGGERKAVVVRAGGQVFVGPDNGVLSLVAPDPDGAYQIQSPRFSRGEVSATFHGRDLFAVAAGRIAAGAAPSDAGPAIELLGVLTLRQQGERPEGTAGCVIHVDAFGNLITDLGADDLPDDPRARPRFRVGDHVIEQLSTTFESVAVGELVAYIGSGNTLEIAVREGDAAATVGVGRGGFVELLSPGD